MGALSEAALHRRPRRDLWVKVVLPPHRYRTAVKRWQNGGGTAAARRPKAASAAFVGERPAEETRRPARRKAEKEDAVAHSALRYACGQWHGSPRPQSEAAPRPPAGAEAAPATRPSSRKTSAAGHLLDQPDALRSWPVSPPLRLPAPAASTLPHRRRRRRRRPRRWKTIQIDPSSPQHLSILPPTLRKVTARSN